MFENAKSDVAIPANLGCGRGGANWIKIFNFIQTISEDFEYDINIYHYFVCVFGSLHGKKNCGTIK